jgi:hypothetical protein
VELQSDGPPGELSVAENEGGQVITNPPAELAPVVPAPPGQSTKFPALHETRKPGPPDGVPSH